MVVVDVGGGKWYTVEMVAGARCGQRRLASKEVQIIPWVLNDSTHVDMRALSRLQRTSSTSSLCDDHLANTVFVGALHGMNITYLVLVYDQTFLYGSYKVIAKFATLLLYVWT